MRLKYFNMKMILEFRDIEQEFFKFCKVKKYCMYLNINL